MYILSPGEQFTRNFMANKTEKKGKKKKEKIKMRFTAMLDRTKEGYI